MSLVSDVTAASTPTRIGKYRIIASLGQGGMARVFLGMTQGPGGFSKLMVVKEIRAELAAEAEFQQMFLTEARIAARLNHGNVVHTYEVGEEDGRAFMAMEYLEGQPLSALVARLRKKGLSTDLQIWILAQTLAGLHYAHELVDFDGSRMEVIHRDVSPPNVFVTYEGGVKLLDFGIAKIAGSDGNTRAGTFKGKLAYAAPEQIQALPLDRRADIFAVGVMLWEVLAKRRLTQGEDDIAIFGSRLSGKNPDLLTHAPDTPRELVAICARAMQHDPNERYATAADFQAALEGWLERTTSRSWSKELSTTLSGAFAEERAKIRAQVEAQVKKAAEIPDSKPLSVVLLLGGDAEAAAPASTPAAGSVPPTETDTPASSADTRPPISVTGTGVSVASAPPTATEVSTPPFAAVEPVSLAPPPLAPVPAAAPPSKALVAAGAIIVALVFALGFALRGPPATATPAAPVATAGVAVASASTSLASSTTSPSPSPSDAKPTPSADIASSARAAGEAPASSAKPKKPGEATMGGTLPGPDAKPSKTRRTIDSKDPYAP